MSEFLQINGHEVRVSNLDKLYWPDDGYRKVDLIRYYIQMSSTILPYLQDRPLVMSRYPEGIEGEFFYHKHLPEEQVPPYIRTQRLQSKDRDGGINYIIGSGVEALVFMANLGAIELHPWFSRVQTLDYPDWAIFDLDPAEGATFQDTVLIANMIHRVLDQFQIKHYPKTSGATGLHIYVPLEPIYTYERVQEFVEMVGWIVVQVLPDRATLYDRRVKERNGKVYIDYLQNIKGKTITGVYSVRPLPGAPISTPLHWDEVGPDLRAEQFNLHTIGKRMEEVGDLFQPVLTEKQRINEALELLKGEIKAVKS